MRVTPSEMPGVLLIDLQHVFADDRGMFAEIYQQKRYRASGIGFEFVQDNRSVSKRGVLRGMHYQVEHPIGHLVHVTHGRIFDVGVDLRRNSPTFGQHVVFTLSAERPQQLFLPPGIAHGFCALEEENEIFYKCTEYFFPEDEAGLVWNDPDLGIHWPLDSPLIKERDQEFPRLRDIPESRLPRVSLGA